VWVTLRPYASLTSFDAAVLCDQSYTHAEHPLCVKSPSCSFLCHLFVNWLLALTFICWCFLFRLHLSCHGVCLCSRCLYWLLLVISKCTRLVLWWYAVLMALLVFLLSVVCSAFVLTQSFASICVVWGTPYAYENFKTQFHVFIRIDFSCCWYFCSQLLSSILASPNFTVRRDHLVRKVFDCVWGISSCRMDERAIIVGFHSVIT
jgi:hypothetical protein